MAGLGLNADEFKAACGQRGTAFRLSHDVVLLSTVNFELLKSKIATCSSFVEFSSVLESAPSDEQQILTARRGSLVIEADAWTAGEDLLRETLPKLGEFEARGVRELKSGMLAELAGFFRDGRHGALESPFEELNEMRLFDKLTEKWIAEHGKISDRLRFPTTVLVRNITGDLVWKDSFDEHLLMTKQFPGGDYRDGAFKKDQAFKSLEQTILDGRSRDADRLQVAKMQSLLEMLDLVEDSKRDDGDMNAVTIFRSVSMQYGCFSGEAEPDPHDSDTDSDSDSDTPRQQVPLQWRYYPVEICLKVEDSTKKSPYLCSWRRKTPAVEIVLRVAIEPSHCCYPAITGLRWCRDQPNEYDLSALGSSIPPAAGTRQLDVVLPFPSSERDRAERQPFSGRIRPPRLCFPSVETRVAVMQTISRINDLLTCPQKREDLMRHVISKQPQYERIHRLLDAPRDKLGLILELGADSREITAHDDLVSTVDFINHQKYVDYHQLDDPEERNQNQLVYELMVVFKGEQGKDAANGVAAA